MASAKKSLLIGCGNSREKIVHFTGQPHWTGRLVTLDLDPECGADVVWDMERRPLPFDDDEFDEIGAYNCMEHWGRQGDFRAWFDEMGEYHRILKPGGFFGCMVPVGQDALADPGHTRFFHPNYFGFLKKSFYDENLRAKACVTDYRWYNRRWWNIVHLDRAQSSHLTVILQKGETDASA